MGHAPDVVTTVDQLVDLYGHAHERSVRKELSALTPSYRTMIETSPFCAMATVGADGLDCTPRGDQPGFVRVIDDSTLQLPDRRGNNRIDSLRNLVQDPRISLLFLIPGIDETLRINGSTVLRADEATCEAHAVNGKSPRLVIEIRIQSVYFQCARALMRSGLWERTDAEQADGPSAGEMLAEAIEGFDAGAYDDDLAERLRSGLY